MQSKIMEIKTGRPGILGRASASCDPIIRQKLLKLKDFLTHINAENLKKLLRFGAYHVFYIFGTVGLFVSKYYGNFLAFVKGKQFLKKGGVVSFFLKDVAESKKKDEGKF